MHYVNGFTERRVMKSTADMRATLSETFGITLPAVPELDPALQRVVASTG